MVRPRRICARVGSVVLLVLAACSREPPPSAVLYLVPKGVEERPLTIGRVGRMGFATPVAAEHHVTFTVPGGESKLLLACGLVPDSLGQTAGDMHFRAELRTGVDGVRELFDQRVCGGAWLEHGVDLSPYAGNQVELVVQTASAGPRTRGTPAWATPVLLARGADHMNVLLVTVDTLRADFVGSYGGPSWASPVLDSLALEGTRFLQAHSTTNLTLPSHASILTSRYCRSHGVHTNRAALPEGFSTLAEVMGHAGWSTCAVLSMSPLRLVARGFDHVSTVERDDALAGRTTAAATRWLETAREPFFLWVHYFDPHWDYKPPSPYDRLWWPRPAPPLPTHLNAALRARSLDDRARAYLVSQYRGEIAYVDHCLGQLLAWLAYRGLAGRTIVAVTADHGESMTEHNLLFSHREGLHQTLIHVPLILAGPGIPRGASVTQPVTLIDLAPTLLASVGLAPCPDFLGTSLLEGGNRPRLVLAEEKQGRVVGVREGSWKMLSGQAEILTPPGAASVAKVLARPLTQQESVLLDQAPVVLAEIEVPPELREGFKDAILDLLSTSRQEGWVDTIWRHHLFSLAEDPGELDDVARLHPQVTTRLDSLRSAWCRRAPRTKPRSGSLLTPREEARLRELGYVH